MIKEWKSYLLRRSDLLITEIKQKKFRYNFKLLTKRKKTKRIIKYEQEIKMMIIIIFKKIRSLFFENYSSIPSPKINNN